MAADPLAEAIRSLERGSGREAVDLLRGAGRRADLSRDDRAQIRCILAEAWLLQDEVARAAEALGKEPEPRERLNPARLSDLWRVHGQIAAAQGESSRAVAFLGRALTLAERAHDSRAIGLAHYQLALCYRQVGDTAIVREHLTGAATALHAAGDRRHLAMVHSLSGIMLAQEGLLDDAMTSLRQAERLALMVEAGDVLATVCGNQANVALMQHRHEQALALAERSVELQEQAGTPHGLGVALAIGYVVFALATGAAWTTIAWHYAFGAAILLVGFLLFQIGVMGGGDAKLIAAAAVWTGVSSFGMFALWTALAGGLLALVLMFVRKGVQPSEARPAFINRLLKPRGGVPYGVAIAAGGLVAAGSALTLP